ncbi:MAG: hypothetical protein Q8P59_00875 [Dehalococcoidia bacterium]|nr:hypothetical protein [Dehalococcoidia bacterium]
MTEAKPLTKEERKQIQALVGHGSTDLAELWLGGTDKRYSDDLFEQYEATVVALEAELAAAQERERGMLAHIDRLESMLDQGQIEALGAKEDTA